MIHCNKVTPAPCNLYIKALENKETKRLANSYYCRQLGGETAVRVALGLILAGYNRVRRTCFCVRFHTFSLVVDRDIEYEQSEMFTHTPAFWHLLETCGIRFSGGGGVQACPSSDKEGVMTEILNWFYLMQEVRESQKPVIVGSQSSHRGARHNLGDALETAGVAGFWPAGAIVCKGVCDEEKFFVNGAEAELKEVPA